MKPEIALYIPVKDRDNPNSVVNLAPSAVSGFINAIPDEFFSMRADELAAVFRKDRGYDKETELEEKLRISFWREYDHAVDSGRMMILERICAGVCHTRVFTKLAQNSYRMAYICTPPEDYTTTMQELLKIGLDQLRDILLQPHIGKDGLPNPRMCDVKMRIMESVTLRVRGSVAHRIETKNLNLNVEGEMGSGIRNEVKQLTDPEEIDRRLKELMGETGTSQKELIDVTPEKEGS